ncbi:MAE_28990/MAE_18760 family HEPN-like nuclease [Uliginosibacterium sp. H1]|uniref:MAE_28990/MAE_18760 family HEPN-like nuclease n=1 Tax=Uliginosibacterium sp. H1 TaxID=3114757 RepID=UPI002E16D3FE|nr:MAE_28990/MAE_18760 family HEPN-like nuclease [Uliginosibacterium sp. H1]
MFGGLQANALGQIDVARLLIGSHEEILKAQPSERRGSIKIYAVASCVTRLYAIYEHFVESLLSDFLDAIPELLPYSSLSEGLKKEYRFGISHILGKIDGERYSHLTHENIILWYHEAISNAPKYRFVTEALTRHDHNLRLNIVENLVSRLDLRDLRGWLSSNDRVVALYEEKSAVAEQLDAELGGFVQLRNDAAHGTLQTLEGRDNLERYCDLISALIAALAEYLAKCLLEHRVKAGKSKKVGVVTEVFARANAFIVQLDSGSVLARGLSIHMVSSNQYRSDAILSMQVLGQEVDQVTADGQAFEVGLQCTSNPRRNVELYVDA